MNIQNKIIETQNITKLRQKLTAENKRVVFTNGCFDILHAGHVTYLSQARALGDALFLGLNSDASVQRLKGETRPLVQEADRATIMAALGMIDYLAIFDEDTPLELIEKVQPDVLVKGGDYEIENIVGREIVEKRGGLVTTIPFVENRSTTNIIQKIVSLVQNGYLK